MGSGTSAKGQRRVSPSAPVLSLSHTAFSLTRHKEIVLFFLNVFFFEKMKNGITDILEITEISCCC